jgi:outer membrane protein assembly factor BamA
MAAFSANFRDYPFIKIKAVPEIIATREGGYGLLVKVTEQSANNFSGVVGYVPPTTITSGYVTGEVTIKLNNISGRGRRLNVYWAKPERNSQEIELSYYEPWIANSNYSFRGKFSQVLRDTLLVAREFEAGIGRRAFRKGSVALNFNYTATMPTVSGRELLRLTDVSTGGIGLNASFDSRDNQINPRRGIQANGSAYLSRRSEDGQGLWQYRVGFNGEVALPLKPQLIAACFWNYEGKWLSAGAPVYGDYYWFGGARSLRGYADDLFGGSEVAWLNSELRWLIGRNGRMHLFFDQGYYRLPAKGADRRVCPHSYGVGLRLDSRMGIIGLDYGFGEGDTFSTAKIHVFLETNF